jgi:hypothetical protein
MNITEELEILRGIVSECLQEAYELNDILDDHSDEATNKVGKIISNLELGVNAL